jgi:ribosomal protein S12 methylthiotransferase accessory factor
VTVYTFLDRCIDVIALPQASPVHLTIAMPTEEYRANPRLPRAALPEAGRLASGRGLSANAAELSCRGEAVELVSCCSWSDEPLVTATPGDLGPRVLTPEMLNGFSATQIAGRNAWNATYGSFDWRPPAAQAEAPIAWMEVQDAFSDRSAYAPADFLLLGRREAGDAGAVSIADSNGCAAGPDAHSARFNAVLELIERDATAQWWYGLRPAARLDPHVLDAPDLIHWIERRTRRTWLLDIATELSVPVVAAVSADPDGRAVALGFAARSSWPEALTSAVTEMAQMEFSLELARSAGAPAHWQRWLERASMSMPPLRDAADTRRRIGASRDGLVTLETTLASCNANRVDIWFADMTRAALCVPVFRAMSTALCHYKPRLGRRRLVPHPGHVLDAERQLPLLV